jgi:hypothetical protein
VDWLRQIQVKWWENHGEMEVNPGSLMKTMVLSLVKNDMSPPKSED